MNTIKVDYYKLLVRPVVVISTTSERGISNAAPFSFNSPISFNPPLFGFSCNPKNHTWKNISKTGEFVVNVVGKRFGPLMHILEGKFPYEVSEIEKAGLTEEKARKVKPPRIGEADAWMECRLEDHLKLGDHVWIAGRVLLAEVREEFWREVIDVEKAKPLAHISGRYFATDMKMEEYKRA
ncbi:MAG: flavin reductase family protein [Candidatus Geothermarchaeales archaeon]